MRTGSDFWRDSQEPLTSPTPTFYRPAKTGWLRAFLTFALGLIAFGPLLAPTAAHA